MLPRIALVVVSLFGFVGCSDDTDLSRFQGKWDSVSVINGGNEVDIKERGVEFDEHRMFSLKQGDRLGPDGKPVGPSGVFKLNTAKDPKWFDMLQEADGPKVRGIYKFVGEELHICLNDRAQSVDDRPTTFEAKKNVAVMVLKRR